MFGEMFERKNFRQHVEKRMKKRCGGKRGSLQTSRIQKVLNHCVGDSEMEVFPVIYVAKIKFVSWKMEGGWIREVRA